MYCISPYVCACMRVCARACVHVCVCVHVSTPLCPVLCCEGVEALGSPAVDGVVKADTAETEDEKCLSCYGAETPEIP